jgi:hypothetical protein
MVYRLRDGEELPAVRGLDSLRRPPKRFGTRTKESEGEA